MECRAKKAAWLLGVGLDSKDGHKRITTGKNFLLVGGSKQTHGVMQDKAMEFNDELGKRGKRLEEITREELHEIAHRVGMQFVPPNPKA